MNTPFSPPFPPAPGPTASFSLTPGQHRQAECRAAGEYAALRAPHPVTSALGLNAPQPSPPPGQRCVPPRLRAALGCGRRGLLPAGSGAG